jgi:hypothetical protein
MTVRALFFWGCASTGRRGDRGCPFVRSELLAQAEGEGLRIVERADLTHPDRAAEGEGAVDFLGEVVRR